MEIALITEEDLPALASLYQQLVPNESSLEKMQEALHVIWRNPDQAIFGAKIEGRLVGTILGVACRMLFGQCKSFMIVEDFVVDSDHRRQGVGTALMRAIECFAAKRNCSYIMLITDTDREEAHRFYASLGYESDHYMAFKKRI